MSQFKTGGIYIVIVCFSSLDEVKRTWVINFRREDLNEEGSKLPEH